MQKVRTSRYRRPLPEPLTTKKSRWEVTRFDLRRKELEPETRPHPFIQITIRG